MRCAQVKIVKRKCVERRGLSRRQLDGISSVRRKDASWSLNWPSGANLLAHKQHKYILCVPLELELIQTQMTQKPMLCASVTTVYLIFFVIGRVLTRLDSFTRRVLLFSPTNKECASIHLQITPHQSRRNPRIIIRKPTSQGPTVGPWDVGLRMMRSGRDHQSE